MSKYYRSGQFELVRLAIVTNSQQPVELDLSNSYTNVTLYESIFDKTMSGTVSFVDTNNIIHQYGLGNGEFVELEFKTAGANNTIKFKGSVYELTGPAVLNDHASGYTLHYVSPISLMSMRLALFNVYKGSVDSSVERIHRRLYSEKELVTHKTKYIENIVMTGQHPMEAINMFSSIAVGSDSTYGYMFFEDNAQFNFKPLAALYKTEPVREFFYSSAPSFENVKNSQEEMFDVFQEFEYEEGSKYIEKINDGLLGTRTHHVSLLDKKDSVYLYTPNVVFSERTSITKHPFKVDYQYSTNDKVKISYNIEPRQSERDLEQNVLHRFKALETVINIGIFGDSTLKVGQTCIANIPTYSSTDFQPDSLNPLSGKFLIAEIKHIFNPRQYNQRIMLIKDSYEERVA